MRIGTAAIADATDIDLLVGRSTILNVGSPIARVSLTSADVADALVTTPTQLLINGKLPGTISMFVWDRAGALRRYEGQGYGQLKKDLAEAKKLLGAIEQEVRDQSFREAIDLGDG